MNDLLPLALLCRAANPSTVKGSASRAVLLEGNCMLQTVSVHTQQAAWQKVLVSAEGRLSHAPFTKDTVEVIHMMQVF